MENLFQNKLFLQYLSGLGSGIAQDKSVAGTLDEITQQNISAQSQAGLIDIFKKMLGGELGEGSKMSADGKGLKLQFDPKAFKSIFGGDGTGTMGAPTDSSPKLLAEGLPGAQAPSIPTPSMPNLPAQQGGGFLSKLNPSDSQPGISASDLAGLTPENVSAALSGALNIEGLSQKKMTDIVDMMYKGTLTGQARARTQDILRGEPLDAQFPINMPGVGAITLREWQSLPMDDREYAAYVHTAKKLGDADIMSKERFINTFETTEREQFLRSLMADEKLMSAEIRLRTAGATTISVGERAFDTAKARQRAYVIGPKVVPDTIIRLKKDGKSWRSTEEADKLSKSSGIPFSEARARIQKAKIRADIDTQIRAAYLKVGKVTYVKDQGWFLDGSLIREDI